MNNLDRKPEEKFLLLFEAAKRSLLTLDILFNRIKVQLRDFESSIDNNTDLGDKIAMPLIEVSALVDYSHRFYSIVDALPLIHKKAPEIVRLRTNMKNVIEIRNYLQHMRGDLSSNKQIKYSILGSLSWIGTGNCYTVFMTQPSQAEAVGIAYDMYERKWVTNYQYELNNKLIYLDTLYNEMKTAYDYITTLVKFSDPEFSKLKWGQSQALSLRLINV
ncbi:MAG: hypothetical protein ACK5QK_03670 [Chryseotalea sp.]